MSRLPDLVRDSRLETKFHAKYTSHIYREADPSARQRTVERREYWKREKRIGRGGFGLVWLERCVKGQVNAEVRAVKQFPKPAKSKDYIRELEAIAKFSHPRYVRCFVQSMGWWEDESELYIAMEYLHLGDLGTLISSADLLPESEVQNITFQILEGLSLMHQNGFVHRDLKPQNILVHSKPPDEWWIKIADFGISKRAEDATAAYSTFKGTPGFMPPESLDHDSVELSTAADIWALGEIAHMMLTSKPAFKNARELFQFSEGRTEFPQDSLQEHNASTTAIQFISASMTVSPEQRLNADQALKHQWMAKFVPQSPRPASITSSGDDDDDGNSFESEPCEDGWTGPTEASARWSTIQSNTTDSEDLYTTLRPTALPEKSSTEDPDTSIVRHPSHSDKVQAEAPETTPTAPSLVQQVHILEQDTLGRRVVSGIARPIVLAISTCGELFAVVSQFHPHHIYIINARTYLLKQEIHSFNTVKEYGFPVVVFSWHKDIIGVRLRWKVVLYDLKTSSEMISFDRLFHTDTQIPDFAFSEDDSQIALRYDAGLVVKGFGGGGRASVVAHIRIDAVIKGLGLNSDCLWVHTGTLEDFLKIYSLPDGEMVKKISLGYQTGIGRLTPNWQTYISPGRNGDTIVPYLVDLDSETCKKIGPPRKLKKREFLPLPSHLNCTITYDSRMGAIKTSRNKIMILNLRTTELLEELDFSFNVEAVAFLRDGSLVVLGTENQEDLLYTIFAKYKEHETDRAYEDDKSTRAGMKESSSILNRHPGPASFISRKPNYKPTSGMAVRRSRYPSNKASFSDRIRHQTPTTDPGMTKTLDELENEIAPASNMTSGASPTENTGVSSVSLPFHQYPSFNKPESGPFESHRIRQSLDMAKTELEGLTSDRIAKASLLKAMPEVSKEFLLAGSGAEAGQLNRYGTPPRQLADAQGKHNSGGLMSPNTRGFLGSVWLSTHPVMICAISANGSTCAVVEGDKHIRVVNLTTGNAVSTIDLGTAKASDHEGQIMKLTLSDTGDRLGVERNRVSSVAFRQKLSETFEIWDLRTKALHRTFEVRTPISSEPSASFTFSPDGRTFVAYKEGMYMRVRFMDTGNEATVTPPLLPMNYKQQCIVAFWNNIRVIYGSTDSSGTQFEMQDLKPEESLSQKKAVLGSRFHVFSHDLSILVYLTLKTKQNPHGSLDVVYVPQMETRTSIPVPEAVGYDYSTVMLRISHGPRDFLAAMFDYRTIQVWDIDEGNLVATFYPLPASTKYSATTSGHMTP